MKPAFADKAEIATDTSTLRHYVVGSLATGSQFHRAPSIQAMPERIIGALPPLPIPRCHFVGSTAGSFGAQTLYERVDSRATAASEAVEDSPRYEGWFIDVLDRLNELSELSADWDHHGAPPIDAIDLALALNVLTEVMAPDTPAPAIVPISGGGLQLEWHRAGLDVEIVVGLDHEDGLYLHEVSSGSEWEGPTKEGFAEHGLAQRLIG